MKLGKAHGGQGSSGLAHPACSSCNDCSSVEAICSFPSKSRPLGPRAPLPTSHESQAGNSGGLSSLPDYLQEGHVRGEVNRPWMCCLEGALDYSCEWATAKCWKTTDKRRTYSWGWGLTPATLAQGAEFQASLSSTVRPHL